MGVATVAATIANIPVPRQVDQELTALADRQLFKIYGLCSGDRPIAVVNYAESLADNDDGTGTAAMRSRRIYLRDATPVQ